MLMIFQCITKGLEFLVVILYAYLHPLKLNRWLVFSQYATCIQVCLTVCLCVTYFNFQSSYLIFLQIVYKFYAIEREPNLLLSCYSNKNMKCEWTWGFEWSYRSFVQGLQMIYCKRFWKKKMDQFFASTSRQAPVTLIQGQIGQGAIANTHFNLVPKDKKCCSYA